MGPMIIMLHTGGREVLVNMSLVQIALPLRNGDGTQLFFSGVAESLAVKIVDEDLEYIILEMNAWRDEQIFFVRKDNVVR